MVGLHVSGAYYVQPRQNVCTDSIRYAADSKWKAAWSSGTTRLLL
jgi:hypothetical protein